jgi:hypothetical protein
MFKQIEQHEANCDKRRKSLTPSAASSPSLHIAVGIGPDSPAIGSVPVMFPPTPVSGSTVPPDVFIKLDMPVSVNAAAGDVPAPSVAMNPPAAVSVPAVTVPTTTTETAGTQFAVYF